MTPPSSPTPPPPTQPEKEYSSRNFEDDQDYNNQQSDSEESDPELSLGIDNFCYYKFGAIHSKRLSAIQNDQLSFV